MKQIADSELILNPDGSIYHLNLLPEDIAPTVIVVGDPSRVPKVSKHFDNIDKRKQKREFLTHTGTIGKHRFTVLSTGIGTDNIDIVLNELDALVNVDLQDKTIKDELTSLNIIRIGTSGGLQDFVELDGFVASSHGLGLDGLINYYEFPYDDEERRMISGFNQLIDFDELGIKPYVVRGSNDLLAHFDEGFYRGITATCNGFYGPQGRMIRAQPKFPNLIDQLQNFDDNGTKVTNFEMETGGIYGLTRLLGHRGLSLNAVVADRIHQEYSKAPQRTIEQLIKTVLERLTASDSFVPNS
ncbi:MAG: phosphorylase [Bacteroidetes bacterium SW_11_45_7]|nr:MAG: phosphorylase [Bacteroidetes bacterium SW_11_45_7]